MSPLYLVKYRSYASGQISIAFFEYLMHFNTQLFHHGPSEILDKQKISETVNSVHRICAPEVVKSADF